MHFGKTFELPQGIEEESDESSKYLTGEADFFVKELEIYRVDLKD